MDFHAIHMEALAAGIKAGLTSKPVPMVVGHAMDPLRPNSGIDYSRETYRCDEGVCGFAWVSFKGNTQWGRWAKKNNVGTPDYPSGLRYWVSEFNQSLTRKEAFANAYAAVLKKNGIEAWPNSKMD